MSLPRLFRRRTAARSQSVGSTKDSLAEVWPGLCITWCETRPRRGLRRCAFSWTAISLALTRRNCWLSSGCSRLPSLARPKRRSRRCARVTNTSAHGPAFSGGTETPCVPSEPLPISSDPETRVVPSFFAAKGVARPSLRRRRSGRYCQWRANSGDRPRTRPGPRRSRLSGSDDRPLPELPRDQDPRQHPRRPPAGPPRSREAKAQGVERVAGTVSFVSR